MYGKFKKKKDKKNPSPGLERQIQNNFGQIWVNPRKMCPPSLEWLTCTWITFSSLSVWPNLIQICCLLNCSSILLNCNRHLLADFREQVQSVQLTSLHFKTTIFESERVDFNASTCFFRKIDIHNPLSVLCRCYAGTPPPCDRATELRKYC